MNNPKTLLRKQSRIILFVQVVDIHVCVPIYTYTQICILTDRLLVVWA